MNKYLIEILKLRTSVTLPGFGALMIANSRTGKIVLNQLLKYDDKVLAKFISEKENIDLQEAQNRVSKFVKEIDAELAKGETYAIFKFGKLSKTENGSIVFEMDESMKKTQASPIISKTVKKEEVAKKEVSKPKVKQEEIPKNVYTPLAEPKVEKITKKIATKVEKVVKKPTAKIAKKEDVKAEEVIEKSTTKTSKIKSVVVDKPVSKITKVTEVVVKETSKKVIGATDRIDVNPIVTGSKDAKKVEKSTKKMTIKEELKQKKIADKQWQKTQLGDKKEKKKRRIWPWILLLLLLGLAIGAYMFQDKVKELLGIDVKTEHHDGETAEEHASHIDSKENVLDVNENEIIDSLASEVIEDTTEVIQGEVIEEIVAVVQTSVNGSYHIIGGAFGEQSNAESFALKTGGTLLGRFNGMYQVAVKSYDTRSEANSALLSISSEYNGAWVLKYTK